MSERERFQAWVEYEFAGIALEFHVRDALRNAWQAARADALREAAKCCEQWAEQHRVDAEESVKENCEFRMAAHDCAAAIRALKHGGD